MSFKRVYDRVVRMLELDPDTWTGSASRQEEIADVIEMRAREGIETTMWTVLLQVEECPVQDAGGQARWVERSDCGGEDAHIKSVWTRDPREDGPGRMIDFVLSARGVELGRAAQETVWVVYRPAAPKLTRALFNFDRSYNAGDVVWHERSGECYLSLQGNNKQHPISEADWWAVQRIPVWLEDFVARGAFAELLRNDGRGERADVEEARAQRELERALMVEEAQQDQHRRIIVTT